MDIFTLMVLLLIILWATGTFLFPIGSLVHILLVVILIVIVVKITQGRPLP